MLLGIGVDIVQVSRFNNWVDYPKAQLLRVFSQAELDEIFSGTYELVTQRMATRYAAKEAFYKALSSTLVKLKQTKKEIPFSSTCKAVIVKSGEWETPSFEINWDFFEQKLDFKIPEVEVNLSLSHEKDYAIAYVIIQDDKVRAKNA